ncbi:MAG: ribonucleoside triphosphate reductase [Patescibacteria group bacterium]
MAKIAKKIAENAKKSNFAKKVQKRDGTSVDFDSSKITDAVFKAMEATSAGSRKDAEAITEQVLLEIQKKINGSMPSVEFIQDIVENVLLASQYKKTAKAYILYREQRAQMRTIVNKTHVDLIGQYLEKLDWQVNENSNMTFSLQGLNNYIASAISRTYWLDKIYTPQIKKARETGEMHIHDLDIISVYCVGWELFDLLSWGFRGVKGKIESGPAKHFRSALGQVVNFFFTLQGEAAGAQAFSNFDTLLAPFIRYDNLSRKEVKQALQEFVFNINVPTRVGFQTPFTNVTLDLTVPAYYTNQSVLRGGKPQKEKYGDFQEEMNVFNRAFLEVLAEGDNTDRVFTFPIPTYNITKDFDWDNENMDILWEVAAKYGIPYFSNFVNSDMDPSDARSMCCRLRIDNRDLQKKGGGLFGANPLTGSIGVVTINLPRIGYLARDEQEFFARLKDTMDTARDSLEIKRKILETFTDKALYPYTRFYLKKVKDQFGYYWKNHFSTIGLLGMNEALLNFIGKDIGTPEGRELAGRILDYMRDKLLQYQMETGNNYNLEATPAEGTSYRLALKDQKQFGDCHFANGRGTAVDTPFYTNSTHLPVNYSSDLFEILDLQDELQTKYTGGTVIHFFLGERIKDKEVVKKLVRKICDEYRLPYFTFSPTFSICPNHGYLAGEVGLCEKCGAPCEIYSRVVGYLRPVEQWNKGKQAEFGIRSHIDPKQL